VSVCVCQHDSSTFLLYYRSRDRAKIFVILIRRVELLLSYQAWQFRDVRDENVTFFCVFLKNSTFLIFLWIIEFLNVVADVYAHRLVHHMYRVSAPITWRTFFEECLLNPVFSKKKKHFRIDYPVPTSRSPGKGVAFHWYFSFQIYDKSFNHVFGDQLMRPTRLQNHKTSFQMVQRPKTF
jgi:hypothetical protein